MLMDCQGIHDSDQSTVELDTLINFISLQIANIHIINLRSNMRADDVTMMQVSPSLRSIKNWCMLVGWLVSLCLMSGPNISTSLNYLYAHEQYKKVSFYVPASDCSKLSSILQQVCSSYTDSVYFIIALFELYRVSTFCYSCVQVMRSQLQRMRRLCLVT